MVGNKGNITARGVVGNKGNTTVGQSKVNAVEIRNNSKGNTRKGESKRSAGKPGGLKRRAARRHMKDDPLRSSKAGCLSAVDAGTHLGHNDGGGLHGKMLARQQRTSMPRRLVPPLCDPVWQEGYLLYVDSAFDPTGLSERVLSVTSGPHIKAQHGYRGLGKGVGSFNFGVVPHMGIPGRYLQTHNRNVLFSSVGREELRACLWRRLLPRLETIVPGWRIWRKHYTRQCKNIPPLTVDGEALPWNGEQLNAFHAAVRHRDRNDARGLPCLVAFCGSRGGVVRVHGERTFVDVATKPGGLLPFDSKVEHEVLSSPRAARAVDDKGRHAPGRISIVFMANIWTHEYKPPAWIRDNHKLLCQQQAESGVVPRRKRTAGAEAKVAAPVSTAPLARRG